MKQNLRAIYASTKFGELGAQNIRVTVDYWRLDSLMYPKIWTKTWGRWVLLYTVEGKGRLAWPNGHHAMEPRDAVLLSPYTDHRYRVDPDEKHWTYHITTFLPRPHWYEWLGSWPEIAPGIATLHIGGDDNWAIREAFNAAGEIANTPRPLWEDFTMVAVERILLLFNKLNPAATAATPSPKNQPVIDPRLQTAIQFMEDNQAKPITCPQVAEAAGISASFLGMLFRQYLHTTPQHYLEVLRINKAQRLLRETDEQITQIGHLAGYGSRSHFCRQFRKRTGQTPREYRKALK